MAVFYYHIVFSSYGYFHTRPSGRGPWLSTIVFRTLACVPDLGKSERKLLNCLGGAVILFMETVVLWYTWSHPTKMSSKVCYRWMT